jgi:hypothetical protein
VGGETERVEEPRIGEHPRIVAQADPGRLAEQRPFVQAHPQREQHRQHEEERDERHGGRDIDEAAPSGLPLRASPAGGGCEC